MSSIFNSTNAASTTDHHAPQQLLDLNDDVLHEICSSLYQLDSLAREASPPGSYPPSSALLAFCSTCRRLRLVGRPAIFRRPTVLTDCRDSVRTLPSIDPWLTYVGGSPLFLRHMQVVRVRMFLLLENDAKRLARVLNQAAALKELSIITPHCRDNNQTTIREMLRGCTLPKLHKLVVSAGLEDIVQLMPPSDCLVILDDPLHLSASADMLHFCAMEGHLETLTHLSIGEMTDWSPQLLQTLNKHMPTLKTLGTVRGGRPGYSYEGLLQHADLFPTLEKLAIVPVHRLGLRFFTSGCSSSATTNDATAACTSLDWLCGDHLPHALDHAARVAFSALPRLRVVEIKQQGRPRYQRNEDGNVLYVEIDGRYEESTTLGWLVCTRHYDGSLADIQVKAGDGEAIDGGTVYSRLQIKQIHR